MNLLIPLAMAASTAGLMPEPPKPPPIPAEHTAAMMAHYPAAALKAKLAGKATLTCTRIAEGAPDACKVTAEKPEGMGFGDAALALAKLSPKRPGGITKDQKKPAWIIDFDFKPEPAAITPDAVAGLHVPARFDKGPSDFEMLDAYPSTAKQMGVVGFVILFCTVTPAGGLTACIAKANPTRFGFERAALSLIPTFKVQTVTDDGHPTAGQTITAPLVFQVF